MKRITPSDVPPSRRSAVDPNALAQARRIVDEVAAEGEPAVRRWAQTYDGLPDTAPIQLNTSDMQAALARIAKDDRAVLERTAERIATFARAQRSALRPIDVSVECGRAGHHIAPVQSAGCYAPGGRFPLPSSVLMTAVTASVAGVEHIAVASPNPPDIMLAAAAIAGAHAYVPVGGAQAIAALAFGAGPIRGVDVIVGPGNRYVTAAKQLVSGIVGIDMLAGPSELVVLADAAADPGIVAADLLGQAEHDVDARPILVTWSQSLADLVEVALTQQLCTLPTRGVAEAALDQGYCVLCKDVDEAIEVCDRIAPEHLEILTADADAIAPRLQHYGGLFIGSGAAEVFGDYGIGPNHVLPTGSTARYTGGLSVLDFLRVRTYLRLDPGASLQAIAADAAALARIEGLEAHARSAERRLSTRRR